MEYWKCLWVVAVAFLLGGSRWWECEGCWEHEKTALLQLKPFFTHIKDVKNYWVEGNQSGDCCEWERVECNNSTGRVIGLFLNVTYTDNNIDTYNWHLNASLFLPFEELISLYLSSNSIAGCVDNQGFERLPSKLNKLEILDLSYNYFNDSILASLSELSSLKSLNLGSNQFTGLNPTDGIKWLSKLNKLEILDLSGNTLLGNNFLSHLAGFISLKTLGLQRCGLKGIVDMLEFNNLKNLKELHLGYNEIESLGSLLQDKKELMLTKLEVLDLSDNLFNNSIFSSLSALLNLKSLYIRNNKLKEAIHIEELNALSNLEELEMRNNEVNDFVPSEGFEMLTLKLDKLEVLNLDYNLFNNNIFSSVAALSNLKSLCIRNNKLKGAIHIEELNALSNLKELYMYENKVNEFVPSQDNETELRLMNLEALDLSWNLFNTSIISSLASLSNLRSLNLDNNQLEGSIDLRELHALKNLEELTITCNLVEGVACNLPLQSLGIFTSLKILSLAGFSFDGTMTTQNNESELKSMNLEELQLSGKFFNTSMLSFFGSLSNLKSLILDYNTFEGPIDLRELHSSRNLEDLVINCSFEEDIVCSLSLQSLDIFPSLKTLSLQGLNILNEAMTTKRWQNLTSLEELTISQSSSLASNFIQNIGTFTSLKNLYVEDCEFNDSLNFHGFCDLRQLQQLDISGNSLKAKLPECFSNLTSLEYLDLSNNQFFGSISVMKSLVSLRELDLSNNNFQIPISLEPLFNLSKLKEIYADNNTIYAETERYSLAPTFQLRSIILSCCGDVESFPQFLYHQHDLQDVDLSNIYFKREQFPKWLLENNRKLEELTLVNSSLIGRFELPFLSFLDLSYLDISKNNFNGSIPTEIGEKLPSLRFLNLSNNYFGGSIPFSIGDMNALLALDLSNNKLTGKIPEHFAAGCFSLSILILSNNRLQGQMFSSNFNLTNLDKLQLDGNLFTGKIPDCLSNCSYLSSLDVRHNHLFGDVPSWMGNMSSLREIIMANNHFEGPIPMEFCHHNLNLEFLDLSMNSISGILPSCFSRLSISQVHLSRNKLEGPLMNAFRNSTSLVTLDLSNNHLTGNIPNWIGRLSHLSYLLLNNNHFEGEIPVQLCKLHHLRLIDLSNNNLSGTIPPCLKITTMNNISQAYEHYISLESYFHIFSTEESLEFATKNTSYFYKGIVLTCLSGIDLSCNKLTGEIPQQVKNFQNIIVLNLSHNSLTGSIPLAISSLGQIESLDLSYNKLSGKIPSQLVGLHFLSIFSVAYNNLSGSTPEWTAQFATFEESSYSGNPFLCGKPLPKKCSTDEPSSSIPKASIDDGFIDMNVFYVSFAVVYVMVLLNIAIVLYINPYWRRAWFHHIEAVTTSCYYFVVDCILT